MNTRNIPLFAVPALVLGIALSACNPPDHVGNNSPNSTSGPGDGSTVSSAGSEAHGGGTIDNTAASDRTGVVMTHSDTIVIMGAAPGTPVYDERYNTSKNVRGYRAMLMAELDAIRARLNDGTRPADAIKKDQERAADLAQGLERMDRLIKAVEVSDDLTWARIRASQLKEAEDVRAWAGEHGYRHS